MTDVSYHFVEISVHNPEHHRVFHKNFDDIVFLFCEHVDWKTFEWFTETIKPISQKIAAEMRKTNSEIFSEQTLKVVQRTNPVHRLRVPKVQREFLLISS